MRVLAHVAQCTNLLALFNSGGDIHTDTATKVFGVSREDAKQDKYRKPIKNVNFGVVYGISAQGLFNLMSENEVDGWTLEDCEKLITDYYALYPEIRDYTYETVAFAKRKGYVVDMFGRRRVIPELKSPFQWVIAEGERQAGNMPIQAGAQGILKLATNRIYQEREGAGLGFKFLMQIHDELVLEVKEGELIETARFVLDSMEHTTQLAVPIRAEAKAGHRWGEADKIEGL
jgi:DNA polymerase-1